MTFRCHQITEDDLLGAGQFWLVVSRNWLGSGQSSSVISLFLVSHFQEFLGWEECCGWFLYWLTGYLTDPSLSALFTFFHWWIFHLTGFAKFYKMTFRRKEKRKIPWLWLDKFISETLKPQKMVLCSSHEIVILKNIKNLPGFQNSTYFTADRMNLVWPPVQMAGQYL
jgi:hypothetical protein